MRKLKLTESMLDQQMQATLYHVIPVMLAVIDENLPVPEGIDMSRLSNEGEKMHRVYSVLDFRLSLTLF